MKFRYYITDLFDGEVKGTNDTDLAENLSACEDYFIVDTEKGVWMSSVDKEIGVVDFKAK